MKIRVIRGQNQIGGSIIEVATESSRIILEAGGNLGENKRDPVIPEAPGLFQGEAAYDAIFVSHYHWDHAGLLSHVLPGIPVYMGSTAYRILKADTEAKGKSLSYSPILMEPEVPVTVGDIRLTPVECDHSAWCSLMFIIEAEGKTLLYSGDFRSTGRRDFDALLERLPHVDALICEGTTLSRDLDFYYPTEQELEDDMTRLLTERKGPGFIYLSAMDPERVLTAYKAAARSGRRFIAGEQITAVAKAAGLDIDITSRHSFLMTPPSKHLEPDFLMCIAPAVQGQIEKLYHRLSFEDGTFIFARREDTMAKPAVALLIKNLELKGLPLEYLHTSGHADPASIDRLIDAVTPDILIPVHTKNAAWFERYEHGCEVVFNCENYEV